MARAGSATRPRSAGEGGVYSNLERPRSNDLVALGATNGDRGCRKRSALEGISVISISAFQTCLKCGLK